ncbi:MAG: prolyl oligopeptidase family serine peptidase [Acidobacteria bacterium]|nr:prolyl oligopeptidase family serine peptidase [Acidobacteriota bacterium]
MTQNRIRLGLFLLCLLVFPLAAAAQEKTGVLFRDVKVGSTTYRYEVFVPAAWNPQKKWPVILFLHGAGLRGTYAPGQNESEIAKLFLAYHEQTEAVIVFPRVPDGEWWTSPQMESLALRALSQTMREFNGDSNRVYLTGLSMGGYGVWYLASRHAGKFAALAPVCGGIETPRRASVPPAGTAADAYAEVARKIGKTPVWIFHGSADGDIPVTESRKMATALKANGGNMRYTEYPGVGHNSWDRAYSEKEFFPWLFSQRLSGSTKK